MKNLFWMLSLVSILTLGCAPADDTEVTDTESDVYGENYEPEEGVDGDADIEVTDPEVDSVPEDDTATE